MNKQTLIQNLKNFKTEVLDKEYGKTIEGDVAFIGEDETIEIIDNPTVKRSDIIDDLNSSDETKVLSAKQGKTLRELIESDSNMEYPSYVKEEKERLKNVILSHLDIDNAVIIGHNTDQHIDYTNTELTKETLYGLKALRDLTKEVPFNMVVLGGDSIRANITDVVQIGSTVNNVNKAIEGANCPVFHNAGNHEARQNNQEITAGQVFRTHITNSMQSNDVVLQNNYSLDGYYDDKISMIRYIFVDTQDRYAHDLAEMRSWLTTCLTTLPNGYLALIFSHHPLSNTLPSDWHNPKNMGDILEANKEVIIASICGHSHNTLAIDQNGVTYITTTTAGKDELNDGVPRVAGTKDATAYDIFVIDKANNKIYVEGYGRSPYREIEYWKSVIDDSFISPKNSDSITQYSGTNPCTYSVVGSNFNINILKANSGVKIAKDVEQGFFTETSNKFTLKIDSVEIEDYERISGQTCYIQIAFYDSNKQSIKSVNLCSKVGEIYKVVSELGGKKEYTLNQDLSQCTQVAMILRCGGSIEEQYLPFNFKFSKLGIYLNETD